MGKPKNVPVVNDNNDHCKKSILIIKIFQVVFSSAIFSLQFEWVCYPWHSNCLKQSVDHASMSKKESVGNDYDDDDYYYHHC